MDPLEMLKSKDIEMVELGCNLLLQTHNIIQIEELLKKTFYKVNTYDRHYITIMYHRQGLYDQLKEGNYYKIKKYSLEEFQKMVEGLYDDK